MTGPRDLLPGAFDLTQFGVAELDLEGRFVAVNSAFLSMLDLRETDVLHQYWHVTVHPDDHGRVQEAHSRARAGGGGYAEIRALRGDGRIVHQAHTVTSITGPRGVITGYYCLRHDLSGYQRDQEALLLAVESAPSGLLVFNSAGRIRSVNRAIEKLFGYTPDQTLGRPVKTLLPVLGGVGPRDREEIRTCAFSQGLAGPALAGRDVRGLRKDGVAIALRIYLNAIETHAEELTLCTIIDIAGRRYRQQRELAKQASAAAQHARSDFLARVRSARS